MRERETEIKTPQAIPQQIASTPEPVASSSTSADSVLQLQQKIGNQAVQRLIQSATEKSEAGTSDRDSIAQRIETAEGSGRPLDVNIQGQLEEGLSTDLSNVRVHTDSDADQLARAVGADAFTSRQDIFFREGTYDPHSQEGMHLLAHEVTHTVQQAAGPVAGTPTAGGVFVSSPSDSFEQAAKAVADGVVAGMPNLAQRILRSMPSAPTQRRLVQRQVSKGGGGKAAAESKTNFKSVVKKTYAIDAKTLEEAAQQIEQREEAGLTEWNPTYHVTLDENGNVASATLEVPITVTLPRWPGATKLNKSARAEWERAFKAIEAHEQSHVNLVREKLEGLAEQMVGKSPADADAIFQEALANLSESSNAYDESTDHGRNEGTVIDTSAGSTP
jgi:predicted secreted Zn-dependent protease